jgi:hypothetical protein
VSDGNSRGRRLDAGLAREVTDVAHLLVEHHRDDGALGAGAGGSAGPVEVGLVLDRRVGVDDEGDVVDVDAAGGDVGRDERLGAAAVEVVHVARARALAEVAVQLDRGNPGGVELAGELLGAVLCASEDDRATGCGGEVQQDGQVGIGVHVEHVVGHLRDRRLDRVRFAPSSVAENSSRWP